MLDDFLQRVRTIPGQLAGGTFQDIVLANPNDPHTTYVLGFQWMPDGAGQATGQIVRRPSNDILFEITLGNDEPTIVILPPSRIPYTYVEPGADSGLRVQSTNGVPAFFLIQIARLGVPPRLGNP